MRTLFISTLSLVAFVFSGCTLVLHGTPSGEVAAPGVPPGLTASTPVRCEANQELTLHNLYITGQGPGVTALGNCALTIEGSTIDVSGVALQVSDNSTVTIRNSRLSGTSGSFSVGQNGTVHASGSVFVGRHDSADNGEVVDDGGNTFND